jgi:peptidoglycan/LPS O-acetylase OafA/YrhL
LIKGGRLSEHKQHFVFLDGMRGIAALIVGWLHASEIFSLKYQPAHAFLAVDFFFCLSGFVIAYAYDEKLAREMTFFDFATKRLIRLYPMILCGVAIGSAVTIVGSYDGAAKIVELTAASALLLPLGLLLHFQAYPINNPLWSLFFEVFANAIYGIERRVSRTKKSQIAALILVILAFLLVAVARYQNSLEFIGFTSTKSFLGGFVRVSFPFLAGMLIYRYSLFKLQIFVPSFFVIAALIAILLTPIFSHSWAYDSAAVIFVFPAIIIFGADAKNSVYMSKIWNILGATSYPFYVIHQPIIRAVSYLQKNVRLPSMINFWLPLLSILLAIGCAYGVMKLYDEPVRRWLSSMRAYTQLTATLNEPAQP